MNINLKNVLSNIEYFWATQKNVFYFGMVFCLLFILNIPVCFQSMTLLLLSPLSSALAYLLVWLFNYKEKPKKFELLKSTGMALLGGLWTLLFVFI